MGNELLGRRIETQILQKCVSSGVAEFIAIYGRRRVGKTFLVKQFFDDKFDFYLTGIYECTRELNLQLFAQALSRHSGVSVATPSNWIEAFDQLRSYLAGLRRKKRVVVFIDELPWLDTPGSRFLSALEHFWNSWGSDQRNLKLVVCGSATTWMMHKLIGHHGGLHNRLTERIHLFPFTLAETEEYFRSRGIALNRHQIVEAYMIVGGIPFYLSKFNRGEGLPQNIDRLFFRRNDAEMRSEYDFLFRSLFNDAEHYRAIVELLATRSKGMTRCEIQQSLQLKGGGGLTEMLTNLEHCDFIRKYAPFGKKERMAMYQLTDFYSLFYINFVKHFNGRNEQLWSTSVDSPAHRAWSGYAFEQVCLTHVEQVKRALGISGVATDVCSWSGDGAQIDLLLDRRDQVVNLCEVKFSLAPYELTRDYDLHLLERREEFRRQTRTRKALHLTMITTYGLKHNAYRNDIQSEVTMDDLFVHAVGG